MREEIRDRLERLGHVMPAPPAAVGAYRPWTNIGGAISVSFQLPWQGDALAYAGRLGEGLDASQGHRAAQIAALNLLAQLDEASEGRLDLVRLQRLDGHVGCVEGFADIPFVLDGASQLLTDVLGEKGEHSRTAQAHHVTPLDAPVMLGGWASCREP